MIFKATHVFVFVILYSVFASEEKFHLSLILSPKDTVATPGSNVSLLCIVRGKPNPVIVWEKDGSRLKGSHYVKTSNGALIITRANEARDEGKYRCKASNVVGTIVSLKAKLGFPFLKKFAQTQSSVNVPQGNPLVLNCEAPDAQPLAMRSIRWSKTDVSYPNFLPPLEKKNYYSVGKNGDLYFSHVTSVDSGSYVCVVGNTILGKTEKRTVKVKVQLPQESTTYTVKPPGVFSDFATPKFAVKGRPFVLECIAHGSTTYTVKPPGVFSDFPTPKYAVKGRPFALECIAHGRPVPKISLKKQGGSQELGRAVANKRTYIIRDFGENDAGQYVCKTTNDYGHKSEATTTIEMLVEAWWVKRPQDVAVDVNSSHTWTCRADGVPPITYTWYHNGDKLQKSARYIINGGTLQFPELKLPDKGMYQCAASNDVKQLIASAELNVKAAPPSFGKGSVSPNEVTSAVKGGTAVILCKPIGAPAPTVTWLRGSKVIQTSPGKYQVTSDGSLVIENVEMKDKASYTCVGKNALGTVKKDTFLSIKDGVAIINFPKTASAIVGRNLSLVCQADAEKGTMVSFKWTQNYMPIRERNFLIRNDITGKRSELLFYRLTLRNSAVYYCRASVESAAENRKTWDEAEILVQIKGHPEPPASTTVSKVVNHCINVSWVPQTTSNSPLKNVIIQYHTLYEPKVWYVAQILPYAGKDISEVKLSPWAFYRFRVILENGVGRSRPGPVSALVESPASAPDKAPNNITGVGDSPTELTISWQPLKPIEQNGPGLHYAVYYRRVQDPTPMTRVQVDANSDKIQYTITDTDYFEQFEFQVQAINALGAGPRSAIVYGHSGEKSPVGEPQNLKVQIMNSRSARATWTGIRQSREATRGKLLGYKVYYWSTKYGIRPTDAQYEPTDETATMLGLNSFTTYFFQVVAYNSKGDGPGSNVVGPLSTPESVPQAPFSLDIHVSKSDVTLSWKPPLKANGIMVGYQVTVKKLPMGQVNIIDVNKDRLEQAFEALDLSGKYQFALLARNRVGFGPPLVVTFDLQTVPKQPPDDVFITVNKEQRLATVKWSKVDARVDGYRVSYWNTKEGRRKSLKFREVDAKSTREVKVVNLDSKLTYKFQVCSFQERGNNMVFGPKSKIYTVSLSNKSKLTSAALGWRKPSPIIFCILMLTAMFFQQ